MINDLPIRKPVEVKQIVPTFGIGERVCFNDGVNDIAYVSGIIVRGAGVFTYLVAEKGVETEVREYEILPYGDVYKVKECDEDDDEEDEE